MVKTYVLVFLVAFVLLIVHANGRNVPGGGRSHDEDQTLKLAAAPVADPPRGGGVDEQKQFIFGGVGGFGGMGGFVGGLFPHLGVGGVGAIGKFGGIGGGIGIGNGGFGGVGGGVGGVGGGLPFP